MDLIGRLEEASEGSRELDLLIKAEVYGGEARVSPFNGEWCLYDGKDRSGRDRLKEAPRALPTGMWRNDRYTASLDAAMTLAPESSQVIVLLDAINDCCVVPNWLEALPRYVCIAALRAQAGEKS